MHDTDQPLPGPGAALLDLEQAVARLRPDLVVEPVRVGVVPTLRVHVGAGVALDVAHGPSAWSVVPVRLAAGGVVPLRDPAAHDLGVAPDSPAPLVVDALGREVQAWSSTVAAPVVGSPASSAPRRQGRTGLVVGLAAAAVIVVGASVAAGIAHPERPYQGSLTGDDSVFDLAVGDCFDQTIDLDDERQSLVAVRDCGRDHEFEVFASFDLEGDIWPGGDAVGEASDEGCYARFADYVGTSWEESELDYSSYVPTAQSWPGGDRQVSCLLVEPAGHGRGSQHLSGR